jgi:hypothetical protein
MTFYGDMAEVATELLTEFGSDIIIYRESLDYGITYLTLDYFEKNYYQHLEKDPVSGETILQVITTKHTVKGIMKKYPENVIDGSRITSSDRQLIIETSDVEPLMTDKITINNQEWPIMEIESINPAGTALLYIVRVRR